jgi:hypothetical protein
LKSQVENLDIDLETAIFHVYAMRRLILRILSLGPEAFYEFAAETQTYADCTLKGKRQG